MQTKKLMLAGAAVIALIGGAMQAPVAMADPIPAAASYADLLEPVPDAMARIHADDQLAQENARLIPAQIRIGIGSDHHHHHHHAQYRRYRSARWYRNHGFYWNGEVWLQGPPPRPRYEHHHHHHHHHHQQY